MNRSSHRGGSLAYYGGGERWHKRHMALKNIEW
jgi:hypothetical protein